MKLDTAVKNRVIVFIGGGAQFITAEQEAQVFSPEATLAGGIKIDGDFINLTTIARIISQEKYYEQFPKAKPATVYPDFPHRAMSDIRKGNVRRQALESMIRGMKNYIASDRYQGTKAPQEFLWMFEARLAEAKN